MTSTPDDPDQPFGVGRPPYPGPQQPAAPYGSYPTGPGSGQPQRPPAPTQPPSVALAVKLMWAGAALGALSIVYTLATVGSMKDRVADQLRETDATISASEIDGIYAFSIVAAIVSGLIVIGLWAWMAWKNGQGRSWARIVATVLAGLNVLFVPFTIYSSRSEPVSLVVAGVNVVLAIVILVLLWKKESSAFYEATTRSRQMY